MPNGPHKITGIPFDLDNYQSDCVVENPELKVRVERYFHLAFLLTFSFDRLLPLQTLLMTSANPKSAKKKKKKAEKAVGEVAMKVDAKA